MMQVKNTQAKATSVVRRMKRDGDVYILCVCIYI